MSDINRILVASDMSESSALAEDRAAKLCRRFGLSELEIVNVQDTSFTSMLGQILGGGSAKSEALVTERVNRDFEPIKKRIADKFGISTSLKVLFGRPSVEILKYTRERQVDLIVVGAKRPSIGKKFFLGNTPDRLLHVTPVPLLIVREEPSQPYQHALVPVDFSENSDFAAAVAIRFMLPGAQKTFLHAYEIPNEGLMHYANVSAELIANFRGEAKKGAEKAMENMMKALKSDNRISHVVQYGSPQHIIEDYVNVHHPDLIIMGKQGGNSLEKILLGSTTRHTVNETVCDILVVPLSVPLNFSLKS